MRSYKDLLREFVSYKSISTDPQYQGEINGTVSWLKELFESYNFDVAVVMEYENPIVVASYVVDHNFETCLIYGHYDVQPASIEEGWGSEPFELSERDGRLFARGVVDNKGQVLIHIFNVLKLIEEGKLRYNIKFLLEGNEETSSAKLPDFLQENIELVKADFSLTSDGELTLGHPSIELGYRGIFNSTIKLKTSSKDMHSGLYGSSVPSASTELIRLLNSLLDDERKITISGFYDDVKEITPDQIEFSTKIPFDMEEFKKITGVKALLTEEGLNQYAQVVFRPSMEFTTLQSGYMGEGYRNSIPHMATAKVSFRLTSNQDPEKCAELFINHVKNSVPEYVDVEVFEIQMSKGAELEYQNKYVERAAGIISSVYDKDLLYKHCGAIVPVVVEIAEILKIPQVVVPLGNEDCNMHAANENLDLTVLDKAMKFSYNFFCEIS